MGRRRPQSIVETISRGLSAQTTEQPDITQGGPAPVSAANVPQLAQSIRSLPEFQAQAQSIESLQQLVQAAGQAPAVSSNLPQALAGLSNFIEGRGLQLPEPPNIQAQALKLAQTANLITTQRNSLTSNLLTGIKSLAGAQAKKTKRPNQFEFLSAEFSVAVNKGQNDLDVLTGEGFDPTALNFRNLVQVDNEGRFSPAFSRDPLVKRYQTAMWTIVTAILRRESGAAISASEFETAMVMYIPGVGDSAEGVAQKRANVMNKLAGFRSAGEPALALIAEQRAKIGSASPPARRSKIREVRNRGENFGTVAESIMRAKARRQKKGL